MKNYPSSYQKIFRAALATTVASGALVAVAPVYTNANETKILSFSDVNESHPYYEGVLSLTSRGVISGYGDGMYRPAENITRAHAAKIIALTLGLDTEKVKNPGFTDVNEKSPNYGPIAVLVEAGVINGFKDNTFRPNSKLTRAEMAKILVLGFKFEKDKLTKLPFTDVNEKSWSTEYIQALYTSKVTTGTSRTTFEPSALVTRGQMASFIHRSELIAPKTDITTSEITGIEDGKLKLSNGTFTIPVNLKDLFATSNLAALKGAIVKYEVKDGAIQNVNSIEITASGSESTVSSNPSANHLVLDGKGSSFSGSIKVSGDYITLNKLTINGNLEIGSRVKSSFHMDGITVEGKTVISDETVSALNIQAPSDKIYSSLAFVVPVDKVNYSIAAVADTPVIVFSNSSIGTVEVRKKDVTIEATGSTKVQEFIVSSNVHLKADKGVSIPKVTVKEGAKTVTIDADVDSLSIDSPDVLKFEGTGNIKEVKVESENEVKFETKGKIDKIDIKSKDTKVSFGSNTKIGNLVLPEGVNAKDVIQDFDKVKENIEKIGEVTNPEFKPETPAPPVIGGGGGGQPVPPADLEAPVFTYVGELHLTVENGAGFVVPEVVGTDNKDVEVTVTSVITDLGGTKLDEIDTTITGVYTITYTAKDAAGNEATPLVIEVTVKEKLVVTEASVASLEDLKTAIDNDAITTINLTANITGVTERLVVDRALTINGGNHTISYTDAINSLAYGNRHGILVSANGVTINDLTVSLTAKAEWQGAYALQVYNATGVTLNKFTGVGADAALLVNASAVELTGTTTVTGNEFGGIEVSKGTGGLSNSKLTVTGTLVNGFEKHGQPTVWVVNGQGTVDGTGVPSATNVTIKTDQTQYYLAADNALDPVVTVASVANLEDLKKALDNDAIKTITITEDITGVTERLVVDRALTINGGNHTISYTDAINSLAYGNRHGILVSANGVTINDLTVSLTAEAEWQGAYALQVYNATGVTLNKFTGVGADAALLVNASAVELTGTTTVTENEFGGIEVSKGTGGLSNSKLTVTGTLVNGSEKHGHPTVWVVNGQGTVGGTGVPSATNVTIKTDQTQYYLAADNALDPVVTVASVANLEDLKKALDNDAIKTITITEDITGVTERLVVDRALTINGGNHTISYTDAINSLAYGNRHGILVSANGVTINDLTVSLTAEAEWQGAYALQVYNATGVTLNKFTGVGADAALLVNASAVELTGTTTVTENEFGGIEVSKGTGGLSNSKLTVTGTLVNGSEKHGHPTVWVVNGQGTVDGTGVPSATNTTIKAEQTQYYLIADNAADPVETNL